METNKTNNTTNAVITVDHYDGALDLAKAKEATESFKTGMLQAYDKQTFNDILLNANGDTLLDFTRTLNQSDERARKFKAKIIQRAKYDLRARTVRGVPMDFVKYCKEYYGLTDARASTLAKIALFIDGYGNDVFAIKRADGSQYDIALTTIERVCDLIPRKTDTVTVYSLTGKAKVDKDGKLKTVKKKESDIDYAERVLSYIERLKTYEPFTVALANVKDLTADILTRYLREILPADEVKQDKPKATDKPAVDKPADEKTADEPKADNKTKADDKPAETVEEWFARGLTVYGYDAVKNAFMAVAADMESDGE